MDVISQRSPSSSLNPNAPMFVPWAYRTVEDFSDQWWDLVQSSPWFRDYWLQECFQEPDNDLDLFQNYDPLLPDLDTVFDGGYCRQEEEEEEEKGGKYLVPLGALKWTKHRVGFPESPKYAEKAPKMVNVKVSPRMIHQPK